MLTTPGLRLSNTERKQLMRNRVRILPSAVPLVNLGVQGYGLAEDKRIPTDEKFQKRLKGLKLLQLISLTKRLPRLWEKLRKEKVRTAKQEKREALGRALDWTQRQIDYVDQELFSRKLRS